MTQEKRISYIWIDETGIEKLAIVIPTPEWKGTMDDLAKKVVPEGTEYQIIDAKEVPEDRTFRDAWITNGKKIKVCMNKSCDIHMNRIRTARNEKFVAMGFPTRLNPDLEKAIIPQETQDKLQALRDIPQTIDLSEAKTPDELKKIWPSELL